MKKQVKNEFLRDRTRENKGAQTIIVSTWPPKFSAISSFRKIAFL